MASQYKRNVTGSGLASSSDHGSNDDLKTCGGCMLCKIHLNTSSIFKSTVTNEKFCLPKNNYGIKVACTTKNVVYLITCDHCNMQYVGMTTTALRTRFNNHRSAVKNSKITTNLYYHFLSHQQRNKEHLLKVQIIFHTNEEDAKNSLLNAEEFYMRKMCTLMPFGLNDNITSMNINLISYELSNLNSLNTPFFSFPSKRRVRGHGHRKCSKRSNLVSLEEHIDRIFRFDKTFQVRDLYIYLRSMNRNSQFIKSTKNERLLCILCYSFYS